MTHSICRPTSFVLATLLGCALSTSFALGQCTSSCSESCGSTGSWDEANWGDAGQCCDTPTPAPACTAPTHGCDTCESARSSCGCGTCGSGCGGGPVEFTISDGGCGGSSLCDCSSCCGGGCGCGHGCNCVGFGEFPRSACGGCGGCGLGGCGRGIPLPCGPGLMAAIFGGCSSCGVSACPAGVEGMRVRAAGPGALGGCGCGVGLGSDCAGGCGLGGCGLLSRLGAGGGCGTGVTGGCGGGCGLLGSLFGGCGGCCGGCPIPPAGCSFHCGMPAPQYPVPHHTPHPTKYTHLTYPPLSPHNALPHYRGTYSYKHGPGLSRTNVKWRPTKVCNAIDRVHHMLEIAR